MNRVNALTPVEHTEIIKKTVYENVNKIASLAD